MAKHALLLLRDPELHRRFSEASRQRVLDNFTRERAMDMYEDYYRRVLD